MNENLGRFDAFLANAFVSWVPVTIVTADRFARIAAALRRKGRPLPTNDVWIAAHPLETGADLLSYDRHPRKSTACRGCCRLRMDDR